MPLLETPFLNLYLELSLGTSELGTSWNFETFQNLSLEALVAWNLHLKPDLEPLLGPLSWNLATFQTQTMLGTLEPSKPVLGTRVFVDLLDPSLATWNLETLPGTLTENLRNSWGLYLESLLGALASETLLKNLCWEPRPSLGTFQNLYSYLDGTYMLYLEPRNLPEPLLGTLARNLGTFWNPLWLEPLLGTSEPAGTFTWNPYLEPRNLLTWNPYLEPRNLPEPLLGTLILGTSEPYLEPLLGTSKPAGTFTWNPYSEPRNLPEPLLGTLTWNLGARRNLYLEPLLGTSEPAEPLLGTLTWNLGTCRNLYLEPLLGTSEPARTWRDDCPRVPQGLVWLGPQSFQLLGKKGMCYFVRITLCFLSASLFGQLTSKAAGLPSKHHRKSL